VADGLAVYQGDVVGIAPAIGPEDRQALGGAGVPERAAGAVELDELPLAVTEVARAGGAVDVQQRAVAVGEAVDVGDRDRLPRVGVLGPDRLVEQVALALLDRAVVPVLADQAERWPRTASR
jgi:hypothetical protein